MSLHLEFEPHSWYMGWAIKDNRSAIQHTANGQLDRVPEHSWMETSPWTAYAADGNTHQVRELSDTTLRGLKQQIRVDRRRVKTADGRPVRVTLT